MRRDPPDYMTSRPFDTLKARLAVPTMARYYGIPINTQGKALCPFHAEKTPLFSVKEKYWHCFGCGASGDVIELARRLHGLSSPLDAAFAGIARFAPMT